MENMYELQVEVDRLESDNGRLRLRIEDLERVYHDVSSILDKLREDNERLLNVNQALIDLNKEVMQYSEHLFHQCKSALGSAFSSQIGARFIHQPEFAEPRMGEFRADLNRPYEPVEYQVADPRAAFGALNRPDKPFEGGRKHVMGAAREVFQRSSSNQEKKMLCRHLFGSEKRCGFGFACKFAHSFDELSPFYQQNYQKQVCELGDACPFPEVCGYKHE